MFGGTRSRYRDRVTVGGSPLSPRSIKAGQKHGAPPAASAQPERSPGLISPHPAKPGHNDPDVGSNRSAVVMGWTAPNRNRPRADDARGALPTFPGRYGLDPSAATRSCPPAWP